MTAFVLLLKENNTVLFFRFMYSGKLTVTNEEIHKNYLGKNILHIYKGHLLSYALNLIRVCKG